MTPKLLFMGVVIVLFAGGCSSGGKGEGSGGSSSTGGQTEKGGSGGSGGASSAGGTTSSGGSATGGSSAGGGSTSSGGNGSGGVSTSMGGATTGGSSATGGSAGGMAATGGTSAKGGTTGVGGTTAGAGGTIATGGTTARDGGVGGTGGRSGGTAATGGTTGTGGGTSGPPAASGYPAAGASGQSPPTGTGTTVTVLDWAGFKSALSFTFDDTNQTQIDHYKELQAEGVRYTFYLWTGSNRPINDAVWPQAVKDGHQLDNHTQSHQSAASATDIQAAEDTLKSKFGVTSYNVAAPNGDASYQTVVPGMKKFLTNRTAGNGGGILPTDDPSTKQFALPCIIPATSASSSAMQSSISSGISGGRWNVFLVHGFTGGSDGAYQPVDIGQFTATVTWAKTQGNIWIDSVSNIASYWIGEFNFKKLVATTSGTDKTWTWKTTDFNSGNPFPTGKYLRVTTNGGTLKQGSTVLTWDDHGYYEVSLDAGTLSLSSQ